MVVHIGIMRFDEEPAGSKVHLWIAISESKPRGPLGWLVLGRGNDVMEQDNEKLRTARHEAGQKTVRLDELFKTRQKDIRVTHNDTTRHETKTKRNETKGTRQ